MMSLNVTKVHIYPHEIHLFVRSVQRGQEKIIAVKIDNPDVLFLVQKQIRVTLKNDK